MVKVDKKRESVSVRMDYLREVEGKRAHDPFEEEGRMMKEGGLGSRCVRVKGPVIVGAGPSGLAASACLKVRDIPSVILERANCIASLWQLKTYDRLHLHLPKQFCQLPLMSFPDYFPTYPTKQQFIAYLEAYAKKFQLQPNFNETVKSAEYDKKFEFWRVRTVGLKNEETEYVCRWLVVATGENAEEVWPQIDGITDFIGDVMHTSSYRSGDAFKGKKVLVVGCGNSGMEVCLDLCNNGSNPSLVVRDTVHVLPREMLGSSTFGLSMWLLKWFPVQMVDRFLLLLSWLTIGDTSQLGLDRPQVGPIELKNLSGKTPVLDVGTLAKIRAGEIKVYPAIKRLTGHGAEFVDGRFGTFDAIILATGYKSNVPSWLKEKDFFNTNDGLPRNPFPNGWKGDCGLYAVGFTKRGLLGASMDATRIAQDIKNCWEPKQSNSKASLAHPHKRKNGERLMQCGTS